MICWIFHEQECCHDLLIRHLPSSFEPFAKVEKQRKVKGLICKAAQIKGSHLFGPNL
jgi:hypothetical protein